MTHRAWPKTMPRWPRGIWTDLIRSESTNQNFTYNEPKSKFWPSAKAVKPNNLDKWTSLFESLGTPKPNTQARPKSPWTTSTKGSSEVAPHAQLKSLTSDFSHYLKSLYMTNTWRVLCVGLQLMWDVPDTLRLLHMGIQFLFNEPRRLHGDFGHEFKLNCYSKLQPMLPNHHTGTIFLNAKQSLLKRQTDLPLFSHHTLKVTMVISPLGIIYGDMNDVRIRLYAFPTHWWDIKQN